MGGKQTLASFSHLGKLAIIWYALVVVQKTLEVCYA